MLKYNGLRIFIEFQSPDDKLQIDEYYPSVKHLTRKQLHDIKDLLNAQIAICLDQDRLQDLRESIDTLRKDRLPVTDIQLHNYDQNGQDITKSFQEGMNDLGRYDSDEEYD